MNSNRHGYRVIVGMEVAVAAVMVVLGREVVAGSGGPYKKSDENLGLKVHLQLIWYQAPEFIILLETTIADVINLCCII